MPAPTDRRTPDGTVSIPDAVAAASGVVLAIIIIILPGGDNIHKLLPGIIGPATIVVRWGAARIMRRTTLSSSAHDLEQLRQLVIQTENDPNASPSHKVHMREMYEAAREKYAVDLTQ